MGGGGILQSHDSVSVFGEPAALDGEHHSASQDFHPFSGTGLVEWVDWESPSPRQVQF